jgi:hypothetical protein
MDPRETDRRLYEAELEHERDRQRRAWHSWWGYSPEERGKNFGTFLLLALVMGPLLYAIAKAVIN